MAEPDPGGTHPEDLPWNDVPADSDVVIGTEEPDPAEVVGDDGEEVDVSDPALRGGVDAYHRDTLDERLDEEEPDRAGHAQEPEAGEFQAPEGGSADLYVEPGEPDQTEPGDAAVEAAEDAAMHIQDAGDHR